MKATETKYQWQDADKIKNMKKFNYDSYMRNNPLLNEDSDNTSNMEEIQMAGENPWLNDSVDGKKIGNWTVYFEDQVGSIYLENPNMAGVTVWATPGWEGAKGIEVHVSKEDDEMDSEAKILPGSKDSYATFKQYAMAIKPFLDQIEANYVDPNTIQGDDEIELEEDDSFIQAQRDAVKSSKFNIEDFDDTDLNGSAIESSIDDLISEFDQIIKKVVPQDLQYSARIAVKKLWATKLKDWKSNMQ